MGSNLSSVLGSGSFRKHYTLGDELGEGTFGKVCVAQPANSQLALAVKVLNLRNHTKSIDTELVKAAKRELRLWRLVGRHRHCVRLLESFDEGGTCYMLMERCGASLTSLARQVPRMSERSVARIFREMLLGVAHLHRLRIVHRDVKPDNFVLGGSSGSTVKICDFGLASFVPRETALSGVVGTPPFMSPEMVVNIGHTWSTDVWSLGASCYLLLYGQHVYATTEQGTRATLMAIKEGKPAPKYVSSEAAAGLPSELPQAFVRALLVRSPASRPTAKEALQLPLVLVTNTGSC